jgi:hypothetical protein
MLMNAFANFVEIWRYRATSRHTVDGHTDDTEWTIVKCYWEVESERAEEKGFL